MNPGAEHRQDRRDSGISTLADAEEALHRFDRELEDRDQAILTSNLAETPTWVIVTMWAEFSILAAPVAGAAWIAIDIVAQLPHGH